MSTLRRWFAFGLVMLMLLACSLCVSAKVSPEATTTKKKTVTETSPKTGENNLLIYTLAGACALAALSVYAGKKLQA